MLRPCLFACCLALPLHAEAPNVATDIAPVHGLVAKVMGDLGAPDLIIKPGVSVHGVTLKPSEAAALSNADVVVWLGEELLPELERPVGTLAAEATKLALADVDGTTLLEAREETLFEDDHGHGHGHDDHGHKDEDTHEAAHDDHDDHGHKDEHGHEEAHDDHGHDDHGHGAFDPHAWLSPDNAQVWLSAIAETLAAADPDNSETYRANARAGVAEVQAAQRAAAETLASVQGKPMVALHDAWHYLEEAYGLNVIGALSPTDATSASPKRMKALRHEMEELGVSCLWAEPVHNARLVATLAEGLNVNVTTLDPVGAHIPLGAGFYPAFLRDLAENIAQCE